MKTKILPNIFISFGLLFAAGRLLAGGVSDGVLNFSKTPFLGPQPTIITIDAPGAGTGPFLGTYALTINPAGVIAGQVADANNVIHGFVRDANGVFTTFDAPGAGTDPGLGTTAWSINPGGVIAGDFSVASNEPPFGLAVHGFVRAANGAITTFDVPGAPITTVNNINPEGVITGRYIDASIVVHGYVRTPEGTITTFDVPGAGTGAGQGTFPGLVDCINPAGAITGNYVDASNANHGFARAANGAITTFDVPGAVNGTFPNGINPGETITGTYTDATGVNQGFVREKNGSITTFDVPGAVNGASPNGINPMGAITGGYVDASFVGHGFVRALNGVITTFDPPGAGTGPGQGTTPTCNNPVGAITGYYFDSSNVAHGFLRTP